MSVQVAHAPGDRFDGAQVWVTAQSLLNDLVLDPILMSGECEGQGPCLKQSCFRRSEDVKAQVSDRELDVPKREWGDVRGGVGILPRPKEIEDSNDEHGRDRAQVVPHRANGKVLRNEGNPADDVDRERLDSVGWRIFFLPGCPCSSDAKIGSVGRSSEGSLVPIARNVCATARA